jgi:hypothetical protein
MSSLNICPEAAVERGRGWRSNASPPLPPTLFSEDIHLKTT